jgi:flagellar protein FlaG
VAHFLGNSIEPVATVAAPSPLGVSASSPDAAAAPSKLVPPLAHAADVQSAISNPNSTALQATLEKINAQLATSRQSLQLSVDSQSGRIIVVVRDTQTGTVIRQLPSEEVLRMASALGIDSNVLIDLTV